MSHRKLTKEQIAAMREVRTGADIFNRTIAVRLREVQRNFPTYITITSPVNTQRTQHGARPYFGAILTARGVDAVTTRKTMRRATSIEARA